MSRVMVHLFSRLTRLIARVSKLVRPIPESDHLPPKPAFTRSSTGNSNSNGKGADEPRPEPSVAVVMEARALNDDVDAWIESLQLATLEHERVQVGNRAYAYAMKVSSIRILIACFYHTRLTGQDPSFENGLWVREGARQSSRCRVASSHSLFHFDGFAGHVDRVSPPLVPSSIATRK